MNGMERVVVGEILDSLGENDPEARRSRRDLDRVNRIMGNYGWLAGRIGDAERAGPRSWVEAGAGDGRLRDSLPVASFEACSVTGIDLRPRPGDWPDPWTWRQGDLFAVLEGDEALLGATGFAANLFLHHLGAEELRRLGEIVGDRFTRIVCCEPARYGVFRSMGSLLFPFINRITRHDMVASIRAGFRPGELAAALGLGPEWKVRESVTPLGAYRFEASRE